MSYFPHFTKEEIGIFDAASSIVQVPAGGYLLRRGEPGGDLYRVEEGTLEVVDRRATPVVILASLQKGDVVGEMSFLDNSPRSADVRAASSATVRRWAHNDLKTLLSREPTLAARFFEGAARTAAARMRTLATTAVAGGLGRGDGSSAPAMERTRTEVLALATSTKEALLQADSDLRAAPLDPESVAGVRRVLDRLQVQVAELFAGLPEPEMADHAATLLGRELQPYLVRSVFAERCIRRVQGSVGTHEIIAHVLVDTATGDGQLGEVIDRWMLDRPTLQAHRGARDGLVKPVADSLPTHRNRRILVLNAGTGSLVAALSMAVSSAPTVITVVDPSRDALAFLDAGVTVRPRKVELRTKQENLVQLALGRGSLSQSDFDAVVVHGLLEYMPDRIALSLLQQAGQRLAPEGRVFVTALSHTPDGPFLDRVLNWPSVRRTPERLLRLFRRAGFEPHPEPARVDGLLVVAAGQVSDEKSA
ncbi:MAG: cyclic nucleotide-binding domain-containing protein [Myxococcota bacterium]